MGHAERLADRRRVQVQSTRRLRLWERRPSAIVSLEAMSCARSAGRTRIELLIRTSEELKASETSLIEGAPSPANTNGAGQKAGAARRDY